MISWLNQRSSGSVRKPQRSTVSQSFWAHLVKELEEFGTGLVDGADDCPSSSSQSFEQRDHLVTGRTVQTAAETNKQVLVPSDQKGSH